MRIILNLRALVFLAIVLALLLVFPSAAGAQDYTVVCGDPTAQADFHSLNDAIWSLDMAGPHTITVSGTCQERVFVGDGIFGQSNLYITAAPGQTAVITPPPGRQGTGNVMMVCGAHDIALERLVIRGGSVGMMVCDASEIDTSGLTIENNAYAGVTVEGNSLLWLSDNVVIRNNGYYGVVATGSSLLLVGNVPPDGTVHTALVEGHPVAGVLAQTSNVTLWGRAVIQGNGTLGTLGSAGIDLTRGSTLTVMPFRQVGPEISGNAGPGILADISVTLSLNYAAINNNAGPGVDIRRLSSAELGVQNTLTGNGGSAVACDSSSWLFGNIAGVAPLDCKNTESKLK